MTFILEIIFALFRNRTASISHPSSILRTTFVASSGRRVTKNPKVQYRQYWPRRTRYCTTPLPFSSEATTTVGTHIVWWKVPRQPGRLRLRNVRSVNRAKRAESSFFSFVFFASIRHVGWTDGRDAAPPQTPRETGMTGDIAYCVRRLADGMRKQYCVVIYE